MNDRIDVAGLGFAILDRVYRNGRVVLEDLGGTCGNVVSALAMLGYRAAPVVSLGDDVVGRALRSMFAEAGCVVDHVFLKEGGRSPVIAQTFDGASGDHAFTFTCPETGVRYPRAAAVGAEELRASARAFAECRVLFADRVSATILEAMRSTRAGGGMVYFEPDPDTVERREDFEAAMALSTVAKFSYEKYPGMEGRLREAGCVCILTMGASGLRVLDGRRDGPDVGTTFSSPAEPVDGFLDASGAGDMTSVGLIDFILKEGLVDGLGPVASLMPGVRAGQRLASANCSFVGARGALRHMGASAVRELLDRRG